MKYKHKLQQNRLNSRWTHTVKIDKIKNIKYNVYKFKLQTAIIT